MQEDGSQMSRKNGRNKRSNSVCGILIAWPPSSNYRPQLRGTRGGGCSNPIQSINSVTQSNPIHNDDLNADPYPIQSI